LELAFGIVKAGPGSHQSIGNLPAEVSSFVGRRRQVSEARRLLGHQRLVTLTGACGVGKTRLAVHVARQIQATFPYGAWLIELAALSDPGLLAQTVATTLTVHHNPGGPNPDTLAGYLHDKELLLVMDNCHHLLDPCATLVSMLLAAAPGLRILATSREVLGVAGEHVLNVPTLSLPDPDLPMTTRAVERSESVRLFADRAAVARPGFSVNAENRTAVARLCRKLDGMPLAIELAALRVRAMSPAHILDSLKNYIDCLGLGCQVAVPRLQTLRAAIDWSFNLCSPQAQKLWIRASVFAGGFDLEAVTAVCSGDGIPPEAVLDVVTELVDKSTIVRLNGGAVARYRMIEPIRQYGLDKLREAGEEAAIRRRYRDYYLRLAEQGEGDWFGPYQVELFTRLRTEHANLRAALEFCFTERRETETGLRMASALWFYWATSGFPEEGRHWLDRALALNPEPTSLRAKALWLNGQTATMQGDVPAALAMLREGQALACRLRDDNELAYCTQMLGVASLLHGDIPGAVAALEEAVARHQANGALNGMTVLARHQLALAYTFRGDLDRAVDLCEECSRICCAHGERWALSYGFHVRALVEWRRGEGQKAIVNVLESLRFNRIFEDTLGLVQAVELLAWIVAAEGAGEPAALLFGAAHRAWQTFGRPLFGSRHLMAHHETCETQARRICGDELFTAAFQQGSRLTLAQAVDYALDEKAGFGP
jgi:non-specific serine/threonine protein kinase